MKRFIHDHWKVLLAAALGLVLLSGAVAWRVLFVKDAAWMAEDKAQQQKLDDLDALLEDQAPPEPPK